jgi:hypothetical protein
MKHALISAEEVADFEARFQIKLPTTYVGIPKPIFAYLACLHIGNVRNSDKSRLSCTESVLLALTKEESEAIARGSRLPACRRESIARELSLSMFDVNDALGRYSFYLNERVTVTIVGEKEG